MSKFIRIGERLFVTGPDDMSTSHQELARQDSILAEIINLRTGNPAEVDAGHILVETNQTITVKGSSFTLDIPADRAKKEARAKTKEVFKSQSPEHTIFTS